MALCRIVFKAGLFCSFQSRTGLPGSVGEEESGFLVSLRLGGQNGMMAAGVKAENDFRARRVFDVNPL